MIFPDECTECHARHIIPYKMAQYAQRENDSATISLQITIIPSCEKHSASC